MTSYSKLVNLMKVMDNVRPPFKFVTFSNYSSISVFSPDSLFDVPAPLSFSSISFSKLPLGYYSSDSRLIIGASNQTEAFALYSYLWFYNFHKLL